VGRDIKPTILKGEEMENVIFYNFKTCFPFIANKAIEWYENQYGDLIVKMEDGETVIYDDITRSYRRIPYDSAELTEDECRREFGIRLDKILRRKNITQIELSEMTGINKVILNGYITGKHSPSFYNVDRIAKALGCSVDDFRYIDI
jgi:DNA-binding Xre family transcriptional regulator